MNVLKLSQLTQDLLVKRMIGNPDTEITGIKSYSGSVTPGDLFICVPGVLADGHDYVNEAIQRGCAALMAEKKVERLEGSIPCIVVPDTRRAMAVLADAYYGHPSNAMNLIGVTGTNGKTTTTHMIEHIFHHTGHKTGLIGTVSMKLGSYIEKTENTTPESLVLQSMLKRMADREAKYAVLEVSSHALRMGRVRGCNFKTAVFTNLSHDHLDYHSSMDQYLEDKSILFGQLGNSYGSLPKVAILNADDPFSKKLAAKTSAQVIHYGIDQPSDVRASEIRMNQESTSFWLDTYLGSTWIHLNVVGIFNVYNALAAIAVSLVEGIPLEDIKQRLEGFKGVKGRFQAIETGQDFQVIVDYAHNPDGLEKVISTARAITKGKIIALIGCEGDRDKAKRPIMAAKAAMLADKAILTSDNPRSERSESILEDMVRGLDNAGLSRCETITSRKDAIHRALELAKTGDCVLILGKGHETQQIFKDHQIPFDDAEIAMHWLESKKLQGRWRNEVC
ncbi:UDP-N-acetylmuramoyl-L-alanyl-D-glutamate--2,6-diaminopimelate ligase [Paenibacillus larvae]|uniref:UDP-N-acetylmuramoyl-L-alanyl-D-glutamate--2, 6-diaminopimelate ligase n=1 Tax=Paenibacillus larvae TaxID=1464 RepID=UPI000CF45CEE|nr:UDP-N-acetylmuramoyl-L-alanyl-D-glutamate--2,6-diaminopimelate ligase [Paenibacillus larvae]MCY9751062.1 UDP-N-acetylmuramoyl-L-alanyl-D-glutamate--2,6-diaminopimelate ligase [Paenibacillus larvae]MCY9773888.1 UDP-N-acetylmuramoyl-L-alanyl-D-glutamate--2,6-diaminopimelate ligase [Paenibacillus larvae]MEC0188572.1 UDP-N-acetylmuramoyl-L-alanyl-D-glutamate--2,6-diaminopimelate ligase [Paenibacillus larvae]